MNIERHARTCRSFLPIPPFTSKSPGNVENKGTMGVDLMKKQSINVTARRKVRDKQKKPKGGKEAGMTYRIMVENRQKIVKKLEELSGKKAHYTRVPRCAYIVNGIAVERNGTVTVEDVADQALVNELLSCGMISRSVWDESTPENAQQIRTEETSQTTEETARTEEETPAVEELPTEEAVSLHVAFPLEKHRADSICNLVFTIYSRGKLLSKSTGGDFFASDDLVDLLKTGYEFTRVEQVVDVIRQAGETGLHGLAFEEGKVVFTGFPETSDPETIKAWTTLAAAMNKNAIKQIHVHPKKVDDTNEKYTFRTWLTRLGMNGPELKKERNILYRNLDGHVAFRTSKDEEKWKTNQAAKRAELKAQKERAELKDGAES